VGQTTNNSQKMAEFVDVVFAIRSKESTLIERA